MTDNDGTTTIILNPFTPDDEARNFAALVETMQAAKIYLQNVYEARRARRAGLFDELLAAQDELVELQGAFHRALKRRERDLGVLLANTRTRAQAVQ
jgi:hypothetical protein